MTAEIQKTSKLGELLLKLGYSKYALESEIVTEDMLDEMHQQDNLPYCTMSNCYSDGNGNGQCHKTEGTPKMN